MADDREIDERDVRIWFMKADLDQAKDTFRVIEGIIQTREEYQPKRKKRSDAGKSRDGQEVIDLKEIGK
jgi:hypothetical protein